MKLLIDLNSIVTASFIVGKDPDGYKEDGQQINTWEYGYSNFLNSYRKTLDTLGITPMHTIGAYDDSESRKRRQSIYPAYKEHRTKRPAAYYEEFNKCMTQVKKFLRELGGLIVTAKRTEADDIIAAIAPKLDCVIWSKDKDLISIGKPVWMDGELIAGDDCGSRFLPEMPRKYIRLYRTLVSDAGDFGPGMGASGFGEKTFLTMWLKFGEEGMDDLTNLIIDRKLHLLQGDVADFKPFQKIIDSADNVYTTWELAGWLPIKLHWFKWDPGFAHDRSCDTYDEAFDEFYQNCTLVTADNLEVAKKGINLFLKETNFVPIDCETDVPEESKAWLQTIYENLGKQKAPIQVDVLESKLVGMSLTVGNNLQHTYYFSIDHADTNNITSEQAKEVMTGIDKPKVAHNASGFEIPVFYLNWGVWVPGIYCSQIAAGYVDENEAKGLKPLTARYFQHKPVSYKDVVTIYEPVLDPDTGEQKIDDAGNPVTAPRMRGMRELTGAETVQYGCDDTINGGHLFNFFETVMDVEETFSAYEQVESDAMYMTAFSFVHGANCNLDKLEALRREDEAVAAESQKIIDAYLIDMGWPGAVFEPLVDASVAEIKRGYEMLTYGLQLKTRFRVIEKVAAAILVEAETLAPELASLVRDYAKLVEVEDVGGMNQLLADNFVPRVEFSTNSVIDKRKLLYEVMNLPIRYYNQVTDVMKAAGRTQGDPATDEDVLKWAKKDATEEEGKVIDAIMRVTNYKTREGLFYSSYPMLVHWRTGKIHSSLKQSSTTSRRFAPAGPNVNQQPKRSEEGKKIRGCVEPHHEYAVIVAPDFSGQELRVGAEETQDPASLACYVGEELKDLHSITAFAINQKQGNEFETYEELAAAIEDKQHPLYAKAKEYRGVKAKPTNFLSQYVSIGGGAWMLGKKLQIPEEEAQGFLDAKSEAFPGIDKWKDEYGQQIQRQGYSETFLGAKKHIIPLLRTSDHQHVVRSALNFRIQSSSAEMTKLVMGAIWRAGLMFKYDVRFYYPVHDEIVFSVARKDLQAFATELKPIMLQKYAHMTVPIASAFSVGPNFADLDEIEWEDCEEWLESHPHSPQELAH